MTFSVVFHLMRLNWFFNVVDPHTISPKVQLDLMQSCRPAIVSPIIAQCQSSCKFRSRSVEKVLTSKQQRAHFNIQKYCAQLRHQSINGDAILSAHQKPLMIEARWPAYTDCTRVRKAANVLVESIIRGWNCTRVKAFTATLTEKVSCWAHPQDYSSLL